MDYLMHVRAECVRLVMEGMQPSDIRSALEQAESLVDYITSGHVAGKANGRSGRQLAN